MTTPLLHQDVRHQQPAAAQQRRGRLRRAAWLGCALLALVGIGLLPWEWSFIDDTALLAVVAGRDPLAAADLLYRIDVGWGLFRPAFWVYVATVYHLPVGAVHALRVAMLIAVFLCTAGALAQGTRGRQRAVLVAWALFAVAANPALFMGVWYPSLQELSGLSCVALGLLAHRRPWLLTSAWLVAAWFKSPFAWLLVVYGLVLLLGREARRAGAVALVAGLGTVGAAALMARAGQYTNDLVSWGVSSLHDQATLALAQLAPPALVLLTGTLALRPTLSRHPVDPRAYALIGGGVLYVTNLLPWRTDAHYAAPYVFMFTAGALLLLRRVEPPDLRQAVLRLAVPATVAAVVAGGSVANGWFTHANVTGLRDCLAGLPSDAAVGYNRKEAAMRLQELMRLREPGWGGTVVHTVDGAHRVDYYIHQTGYGDAPGLTGGAVICRTHQSTVHLVRQG